MMNKQDVQNRVLEFMRQEGLSETDLSTATGIPQATLNRMLKYNPSYKGSSGSWRRLAQYAPLHLEEAEVLAAIGLGPALATGAESDPWALFERAMSGWALSEDKRIHLRRQIGYLLDARPHDPIPGP